MIFAFRSQVDSFSHCFLTCILSVQQYSNLELLYWKFFFLLENLHKKYLLIIGSSKYIYYIPDIAKFRLFKILNFRLVSSKSPLLFKEPRDKKCAQTSLWMILQVLHEDIKGRTIAFIGESSNSMVLSKKLDKCDLIVHSASYKVGSLPSLIKKIVLSSKLFLDECASRH